MCTWERVLSTQIRRSTPSPRVDGDGGREPTSQRPTVHRWNASSTSAYVSAGDTISPARPNSIFSHAQHQYNGNSGGGLLGRSYLFLSLPCKTAVLRARDCAATIVAHLPRDDEARLRGRGRGRGLRGTSIPRLQPLGCQARPRASRDFLASSMAGKAKRERTRAWQTLPHTHTQAHIHTPKPTHHLADADMSWQAGDWQLGFQRTNRSIEACSGFGMHPPACFHADCWIWWTNVLLPHILIEPQRQSRLSS